MRKTKKERPLGLWEEILFGAARIRGFFELLWVGGTGTDVHEFLKDLGEELDLEERN